MTLVGVALILLGIALMAFGWRIARVPWRRLQELRRQDANIARYERWRGGTRASGETGASVAMRILSRQARKGFVIMGVGAGLIILAFFGRL